MLFVLNIIWICRWFVHGQRAVRVETKPTTSTLKINFRTYNFRAFKNVYICDLVVFWTAYWSHDRSIGNFKLYNDQIFKYDNGFLKSLENWSCFLDLSPKYNHTNGWSFSHLRKFSYFRSKCILHNSWIEKKHGIHYWVEYFRTIILSLCIKHVYNYINIIISQMF